MKIKKIIASIVITMLFVVSSEGVMVMNNVTDPLPPGKEKSLVSDNVVLGAQYFLNGYASALQAFSVYENPNFDVILFRSNIDNAVNEMTIAKKYYSEAYNTVISLSILAEKQNVSSNFDFDVLSANFKNKTIYYELVPLFRECNVAGIHKKNLENIENILNEMSSISVQKPEPELMWRIFSSLIYTAQFGNYATQIAHTVFK